MMRSYRSRMTKLGGSNKKKKRPSARYQGVYEPLSQTTNIRLVTLLPGALADDICITLEEHEFDETAPPIYEAVSYVWGSDDDPAQIKVGSTHVIEITRNLYIALRYLRCQDAPRVLWIDALAINQADNQEKSTQVAMMAKIYKLANRVVAWLGPAGSHTQRAMQLMINIGSQLQVQQSTFVLKPAPGCNDTTLADTTTDLHVELEDATGLDDLICRPWFDRLWVRQEITVANSRAVIQCGPEMALWEHFRNALLCLYLKSALLRPFNQDLYQRLGFLRGFILQLKNVTLRDLNLHFENALCRDPRDRIYATASMFHEVEINVCPIPDYSQPYLDIYREVFLRYSTKFGSLDLLCDCGLPLDDKWASWVPDWSRKPATDSLTDAPVLASSRIAGWLEYREPNVLRVAGIPVAIVAEVVQMPQAMGFMNRRQTYDIFHELLRHQHLGDIYLSGCSMLEAYARTLVCGSIADELDAESHGLWPALETVISVLEHIQAEASPEAHFFSWGSPAQLVLENAHRVYERSFIKTDKGHIGFAPNGTAPGDIVCVVVGCRLPLILRSTDTGKYQIVGESFVHGLSDGEAILGPLPPDVRTVRLKHSESVGSTHGFVDGRSGSNSFVDPRLDIIPYDFQEYREAANQNANVLCPVPVEVLMAHCPDMRYLDLV